MLTPLRRLLGRARRWADRRTLDEPGFRSLLGKVGVAPGATILVHSSMNELARRLPGVSPVRIVGILQDLVGQEGTLLMPTLPFKGRQFAYVDSRPTFDVRRTASQSGLLTEVFRRMPGVERSRHPVCSVAAWGRHARALVGEHHLGTAFGENSPYFRLARVGGLEVGLGTPFWATFSLTHVAEELDPATRRFAYDATARTLTIADGDERLDFEHHPLRPDRERDMAGLEQSLLADGTLRAVSSRGLRCTVASGARLLDRCRELIAEGRFWFGPLPREGR